ncbi:MAG: radical SAM protein [Bacteroidota bacterium]|nr:radical SAM protein [Bacteroidota bacterium]
MKILTDNKNIISDLNHCRQCPRYCGVKRLEGDLGYCNSGAACHVSSLGLHFGEEPVLSGSNGICNVFFSRCNLSCIFCQNYQISSRNNCLHEEVLGINEMVLRIEKILDKGTNLLGFVSPSHFIPQIKDIVSELNRRGRFPRIVYNTNAYDTVESIKSLENIVDIYLPDFKYMDSIIAKEYSGAENYPVIALAAIKEMYHQKGSLLLIDDKGKAESGLIIRHLVLPGNANNSIAVLNSIANELSVNVHISLMSQYNPMPIVAHHPNLFRKLRADEYKKVSEHFYKLGFHKGWVQELHSSDYYNPDFSQESPFEFRV